MISQWDSLSRDNARQKLDDEMTERVAASAPHGFQGNASFQYDKRSGETNVKSRLLEVATWVWYIAAVGFVACYPFRCKVFKSEFGEEKLFGLGVKYFGFL